MLLEIEDLKILKNWINVFDWFEGLWFIIRNKELERGRGLEKGGN